MRSQRDARTRCNPAGDVAKQQKALFVPVFWVAVGVFVIVEGGIVYIALKYRHRKGRDRMPKQTHGNTRLEIGWTIAPGRRARRRHGADGLADLGPRPPARDGALNITVEGYQWWWGFEYPDDDMVTDWDTPRSRSPTRMVMPTGRDIYLSLEAAGGGAQDDDGEPDHPGDPLVLGAAAVRQAGRRARAATNHILFSVDEPGTYTGQCAEFCGLQHGRMKLEVVALDPAEWEAWVANQQTLAPSPTDPLAEQGEELFLNPLSDGRGACTACHAVGERRRRRGAEPDATSPTPPTLLRRLQLVRPTDRGGPGGVARGPGRREARGEDARLRAHRRGDRCPRRLPVQPDVMEAITDAWRA